MTFVHGAAYMTACIGPRGENIEKLKEMTKALLPHRLPMIVVADWNMEPQELATTGLLDLLGVDIVTPRGVHSTCIQWQDAGYSQVSMPLIPAVQVSIDLSTPWRAHSSLVIEVSGSPMSIQVRSPVVPSRFDLSVVPNAQGTWTPRGAALPIFVSRGVDTAKQMFPVLGDNIVESMLVGSNYVFCLVRSLRALAAWGIRMDTPTLAACRAEASGSPPSQGPLLGPMKVGGNSLHLSGPLLPTGLTAAWLALSPGGPGCGLRSNPG